MTKQNKTHRANQNEAHKPWATTTVSSDHHHREQRPPPQRHIPRDTRESEIGRGGARWRFPKQRWFSQQRQFTQQRRFPQQLRFPQQRWFPHFSLHLNFPAMAVSYILYNFVVFFSYFFFLHMRISFVVNAIDW